MTLGDVLRELGDSPLQGHKWADSILSNLNSILPNANALTATNTGNDALKAITSLPESERDQLLKSDVDLIRGTLTLTEASTTAAVREEAKSDAFHQMVLKEIIEHPRSTLTLVLGVCITVAIVVIVSVMTTDYVKHGKTDTSFFVTLLKALMDILSSSASSN